MILRKGGHTFPLPEPIDEATAALYVATDGDPRENPKSMLCAVWRTSLGRLAQHRKDRAQPRAIPNEFAVYCAGDTWLLEVHPALSQDAYAVLRFNPPAKEI